MNAHMHDTHCCHPHFIHQGMNDSCCCSSRRFRTKEEKRELLEQYRSHLKLELDGVEERINELE